MTILEEFMAILKLMVEGEGESIRRKKKSMITICGPFRFNGKHKYIISVTKFGN